MILYVAQIKALLQQDIDWSCLVKFAQVHGLLPLSYATLSKICSDTVPHSVLEHIRVHFCANVQRNLYLSRKLLEILSLFENNGIIAIPYKGSVLAECGYRNFAPREVRDLDILVRQQDVSNARQILLDQGFELEWPRLELNNAQEGSLLRSEQHYIFNRYDGRIRLELHWRFTV